MNTIWSTVYYCCCLSNLDLVTYRPRGPTRLFLLVPTNNLCSIPIGFLTFREGNLPIATMLTHAYIINYMFCILIFSSYLWKLESFARSLVEEEKINIFIRMRSVQWVDLLPVHASMRDWPLVLDYEFSPKSNWLLNYVDTWPYV